VAAIQLEPKIADVAANLEVCERLADGAAHAGADWIVLPEFFTTGIAFDPELGRAALAPDGAAVQMLRAVARRHGVTIGGSFLCRDEDGDARNAFVLVLPDGSVAGRHDKDLPTMWENSFYVGGSDDGIIDAGGLTAGVALCWELMRTQTVRRLQGRVDLVVGGSGWWSIPRWPPIALSLRIERRNARLASTVAERFARFVGAPVVHAANAGPIECDLPAMPGVRYRGVLEGGAVIADADGRVLARRTRREGQGFAIAEVAPRRIAPLDEAPDRFWLHRRQLTATAFWHAHRLHGRRYYARRGAGLPPLALDWRPRDGRATAGPSERPAPVRPRAAR
jgi:predicted amidohydrolase